MGFSDFCELTGSVVGLNDNLWMALFKSSFGLQEQSVAQPVYFFQGNFFQFIWCIRPVKGMAVQPLH